LENLNVGFLQGHAQSFITYSSGFNQSFMTTNSDNSHLNSVPSGMLMNRENRMHARNHKKLVGLALMITCVGGCHVSVDTPLDPGTKFGVFAGPDMNVVTGDTVGISATAHHRTKQISVRWTQLSGPSVIFADWTPVSVPFDSHVSARFEAPFVSTTTSLEFRLEARTASGARQSDTVTIVVEPISATALCLQATLNAATYVWTSSGCTTNSAEIPGDSRVATLYRQGEVEPNDSLQAANPMLFPTQIATERVAADIDGSIHGASGDAADYYVFTPPISGDYHVYLCNDPVACQRGTLTDERTLVVYDQDFTVLAEVDYFIPCCGAREQSISLPLVAGLPYYVSVLNQNPASISWEYNLTVISD
jgi:hypothetical protein